MSIQDEIDRHKAEIARLESRQRSCAHQWKPVQYDPIIRKGFMAQPQWAHPGRECADVWFEGSTTPRWSRCCSLCGFVQYTTNTKTQQRQGAIAGTTGTEQVPDFGDERR